MLWCSVLLFSESATIVLSDYKKQKILYYRCFEKSYIHGNRPRFDRGRMQRHEGWHSEVSLPKRNTPITHQQLTPSEACLKVNVFTGMHKQLELRLHQEVRPVCIFTTSVAVPVSTPERIVTHTHICICIDL